jgi:2,4-diketo-3-deoxy-L-fuconate hydrolase
MKVLRVGVRGAERPALLDAQSKVRDLSGVIDDVSPEWLADGGMDSLSRIDVAALPILSRAMRIGAPI